MDFKEEIKRIEEQAKRCDDWFYHAFFYSEDKFRNMLIQGIKSRRSLHKRVPLWDAGHNGKHYISLSKLIPVSLEHSAYENYKSCFSFVLTDINPIKCFKIGAPSLLANTIIPIRFAATDDEYQMYKEILPDKFVGIRTILLSWYLSKDVNQLIMLKKIISVMKSEGINLPIFDYSRGIKNSVHTINQDEFMSISDDLIDSISDSNDSKRLVF